MGRTLVVDPAYIDKTWRTIEDDMETQKKTLKLEVKKLEQKSAPAARRLATSPVIGAS